MISMTHKAIVLLCAAIGGTLFWVLGQQRRQALKESASSTELLDRAVLWQPYNELLLGVVFALASLFFAIQLIPEPRWTPPLVALGVALLSTIGAWTRLQHAWAEAGAPDSLLAALHRQRLALSIAMFVLLTGVLLFFFPRYWFP